MIFNKDWRFWLEWASTVILIIGVGLTSFNIFPLNNYVSFVGNMGWTAVAIIWRKWSLLSVQLIISIIYIIGTIDYWTHQ